MGLTDRLLVAAARRPHVLLVRVPGARDVRWAAEDALRMRGWPLASSPADADLLLCCGEPGPELAACVEVAWQGLPGPRVRAEAMTASEVTAVLDRAARELTDAAAARRDAVERAAAPLLQAQAPGQHDMGGMDMSGHDMAGMDMGMDLPGGLVMADRMEDRDGLRLEGLHLSLGPLLPHWPAGLVLDLGVSGDVVTTAAVRRLDDRPEPSAPARVLAVDALADLLGAAGWVDGATRARRARAEGGAGPVTDDMLRRLRRGRVLRWSLQGIPGPGGVDLVAHLDALTAALRDGGALPPGEDAQLARVVVGQELGTVALQAAAYGPLTREAVGA